MGELVQQHTVNMRAANRAVIRTLSWGLRMGKGLSVYLQLVA
jgi:hypothetical protein